jgi:hypothetical protein
MRQGRNMMVMILIALITNLLTINIISFRHWTEQNEKYIWTKLHASFCMQLCPNSQLKQYYKQKRKNRFCRKTAIPLA